MVVTITGDTTTIIRDIIITGITADITMPYIIQETIQAVQGMTGIITAAFPTGHPTDTAMELPADLPAEKPMQWGMIQDTEAGISVTQHAQTHQLMQVQRLMLILNTITEVEPLLQE